MLTLSNHSKASHTKFSYLFNDLQPLTTSKHFNFTTECFILICLLVHRCDEGIRNKIIVRYLYQLNMNRLCKQ